MRTLIGTFLIVLGLGTSAAAQPGWVELPTPTGALEALGLDPSSGTALALERTMRVLHSTPRAGVLPPRIADLEQLLSDVDAVEQESQRLGNRGLSLAMAGNPSERDVLEDVLKVLGFELRERRNAYTVEADRDKEAVELRKRLATLGFETTALEATLNAGGTVAVAPKVTPLPSPLPLDTWTDVIFEKPLTARSLFGAIARERNAALLLIGLSAMSPDTRAYVVAHPSLLRHLYRNCAGAVAAFGEVLQIDSAGQLQLPGGPDTTALWEGIVGERTADVERFARALFDNDGGRLAYFVDTLSRLDPTRQKFAFGMWLPDPDIRLDRFRALQRTFTSADPNWSVSTLPFTRGYYDPSMLLAIVQVNADGSPSRPVHRRFWRKALDGTDLPGPGAREVDDVSTEGAADAAFFAEQTGRDRPADRRLVLERIAFGQRVFGTAADSDLESVLVALRAFGRYPALMLATERVGVRTPAVFAAVARRARVLDELGESLVAVAALGQFQGALALLQRLARTGAIDVDGRERLVASLAAQELTDGRYAAAIARWIKSELLPALPPKADPLRPAETTLLAGLADRAEVEAFDWEGEAYTVDVAKASLAELVATRTKQGGNSLDAVIRFSDAVHTLQQPKITIADIKAGAAALKAAGAPLIALRPWPDSDDRPPDLRMTLDRAVRDLERITKPADVEKAVRIVRPAAQLVDDLLAETLVSLAYAPWLGDPSALLGPEADISHRHRFGLRPASPSTADFPPWQRTMPDTARVDSAGFTGSLLALDLVHAPKRLRRLGLDSVPAAPRFNGNDVTTLTETLALMNPREIRSAELRDIGAAVAQGRKRVREATDAAALEALASEVLMPGGRRHALSWAQQVETTRVDRLFSMSELLTLGSNRMTPRALDAWGTTAEPSSGCFCLRFPPGGSWSLFRGRRATGLLGAAVPDIALRVAEHLASSRVPAALVVSVTALATQALIDGAAAMYDDDWLAIVGHAHSLSRDTVDDYVAAVVANGPVQPTVP